MTALQAVSRGPRTCSVDTCETTANVAGGARGLCGKHYQRWKSTGDPEGLRPAAGPTRWRRAVPTYYLAHERLGRLRGSASEHECPCGKRAAQWAYDHADEDEIQSECGAYSADPQHYIAMCVSCHKRFDMERIKALALVG